MKELIEFFYLVLSDKLTKFLLNNDRTAKELFKAKVRQIAAAEGVIDRLKAANQMKWLRLMNSIRACAEEIVIQKMVY